MLIHEAVKQAMESGGHITRPDYFGSFITPTDSRECCIISRKDGLSAPRWEPIAADLVADDWEVTKE